MIRKQKKAIIGGQIKDYAIRNFIEVMAMIFLYSSTKFISISLLMLLLNSKALFIYLFQTIYNRKFPPISFCICCVLSFIGMVLVISPSKSSQQHSEQIKGNFFGICLCCFGTVMIGLADTYLYLRGNHKQATKWTRIKICCTMVFSIWLEPLLLKLSRRTIL